ncbi:MAG: hypothetical protein AAF206_00975 [Bacteroidota bacterium]
MKPPICAVCRKDFRASPGEGGLVRFRLTEAEKARNDHMRANRIMGHPSGTAWFCGAHYQQAKSLKHLILAEALANMT